MDMGRSEGGDFQLQYPKPPPTPYKTLLSDTHQIRTEMQEHQLNQADWLGSERSAPDFGQAQASMEVSSFHSEVAFTGLNGGVVDGLAGKGKAVVTKDAAGMCMNQSLGAMDQWDISFGDLLALAEAASKAGNAGQIGGRVGASSSACVSLPANNFAPGSNFQFHGNCTPENNGLTIPRHFTCDLNFPPGTAENVVSTMSIPRFAPMTPAKAGRAENNHVSESQNLEVYGKENQEENENEVAVTGGDTNQLQGPSKPDTDSSDLAVSNTAKENQDTEEGSQNLDLSKTPQQKPKKRKHRPKVVREDKPKQTPKPTVTPKSTGSKENPTGKRKYVRKAKPATTPAEVNSDSADPKTLESQVTKNSCRRALKFGAQGQQTQQQDENSTQRPVADLDSESRVENTKAGIEYDLTCSEVLKDDMSLPEESHEVPNEGKSDQVTVLGNIAKTAMKDNTQSASRSPNDSTSSTSAVLTEEVPTRRSKRNCSRVIEEASNTNRNGVQFNNLQFYASLLHFPNIYKKRRSEKGQNSVTSGTSSCWNSASQLTTGGAPDKLESGGSQQDQTIKYLPPFTQQVKLTKKRSRAVTRVRDLASLNKLADCEMQTTYSAQRTKNSEQPHMCIEALVAKMQPTLAKRKRSKMRNYSSGLASSYSNKMVLYKHHQSFAESSGGRPKVMSWQDHVDAVTEQFKYLDINREGRIRRAIYQEMNRLVPYNQDQNALVLYRSNGTMVPFQGAFSPIKKRRERPKVELDDETNKVWRLLLENINNEGIDGTDEEKRRWWEEERRVFRGRADSFIARMHLVQGDRRFSRWKGSVVDSVIGVFLTQNVSDHLSSSAFMSLAARYPLKSEISHDPLEEEDATLSVKEPEVCVLDSEQTIEWKKKIPTQRDCDQSSVTLPDNEQNEEKEVVNSIVFPGINIVTTSLVDTAKCSALNFAESELEVYHNSATRREMESSALNGGATNDVVSSQNSVNSSQNTVESSVAQTANRIIAYSGTNSEADLQNRLEPTFTQLLKMAGSSMLHEVSSHRNEIVLCGENSKDAHSTSEQSILTVESASQGTVQEPLTVQESSTSCSENNQLSNLQGDENVIIQSKNWLVGDNNAESLDQEQNKKAQQALTLPNLSGETLDVTESAISATDSQRETMQKAAKAKALKEINAAKQKSRRVGREIRNEFDWDSLRREAEPNGKKRDKTPSTMDSLDWEAVRCADVNEIADTIKERGMNNMLAERIKAFLNRLVKDHGSIDLEWLRDVPPDKAKEYLLSIRGLGLKSVECVRLLTLHHLAFPVDTNVGRIAVRLGWVPLQPLPESLQLHLLELYPVLESIQKYLWPRLCKLEQKQLYELHYQMITFGKVFCTKSKPNCNACPMRGECRHFASAFASARLALPAPEEKGIVPVTEKTANLDNDVHINRLPLPPPQAIQQLEGSMQLEVNLRIDEKPVAGPCEPIIEEPASPEPDNTQDLEHDIEDVLYDDPDEIPTIKLNIEEFTQNLQNYMEKNMELQEGEMSKALVALTPEVASLPVPKLKNVSRLRTEHQVYELPDSHPLLEGMDKREPDDPCSYLLAIWTPGETASSIQPPEGGCCYQDSGKLCDQKTCFACNTKREANSQMVRGTLLIPCRTAMRGSFPLNGTYFQVNEVFADHDSSLSPIDVPRSWLWNLPRRTVYFGTSVPSIFKGLPTEGIQHCFWRGYVCVRGFDQKTRAPRPLMARLHFPASKLTKSKGKTVDE